MSGAKRKMQMISKFLGSFIIAFVAFGAIQAFAADASENVFNSDWNASKTVQGNAHFELHHTLIPLVCTPIQGCAKSQPYWTVVVTSDGIDYELDAQFDLGSADAPLSVDLLGVTVRSGALITVEGNVEYSNDHYALLDQVRRVGLVRPEGYSAPISANFMNWSCRGQLDDSTQVLAEVWSAGSNIDDADRYRVRVSGSENRGDSRRFFDIGYIDDAHASRAEDQIIYDGKSLDVSFTVAIRSTGVSHDVPGTLKLNVVRPVLNQNIPMDEQVAILCNRTRSGTLSGLSLALGSSSRAARTR